MDVKWASQMKQMYGYQVRTFSGGESCQTTAPPRINSWRFGLRARWGLLQTKPIWLLASLESPRVFVFNRYPAPKDHNSGALSINIKSRRRQDKTRATQKCLGGGKNQAVGVKDSLVLIRRQGVVATAANLLVTIGRCKHLG